MSAFGPKRTCRKTQSMSPLGVKRTWWLRCPCLLLTQSAHWLDFNKDEITPIKALASPSTILASHHGANMRRREFLAGLTGALAMPLSARAQQNTIRTIGWFSLRSADTDTENRILAAGFSRGAYTVRCLGAVIANCGIPTQLPGGEPLKLDEVSTRKVASYAVKHVYQFTSSRPRHSATPRQQFLLQARDLIAQRVRHEHNSAVTTNTE